MSQLGTRTVVGTIAKPAPAPEAPPDTIELAPGNTVKKSRAVKPLRDAVAEAVALEAEIAEKQTKLASKRAKAAELQGQLQDLENERDGIHKAIREAERTVYNNDKHIAEQRRSIIGSVAGGKVKSTAEQGSMIARLRAVNEVLTEQIAVWKAERDNCDKKIADFCAANGVES